MKQAQITVLMPVYNAELYLREAIDSILDQTFTDFEFIIINDGSTDGSEEIIKSYIAKDDRIKYHKNEQNIKLIATLNKGIELAQGKYIVRMDADDISLPQRFQKQFDFMELHPEITMAGSWFESFGSSSGLGKYESDINLIRLKMLYQTQFCHPSVIIRKRALDSFSQPFDPLYIHAEDYDLFSKLTYHSLTTNIPEVLIKYRVHAANVSVLYKHIQIANSIKIQIRNYKEIGLLVSAREVEDMELLAYQRYDQLVEETGLIEGLLNKIILNAPKTALVERKYLLNFVNTYWFSLCYNLIGKKQGIMRVFNFSVLTKNYLPWNRKVKFYLKCLFNLLRLKN